MHCCAGVWTLDGGLVGMVGAHQWDLDNPTTWRDPLALKCRAPLPSQAQEYMVRAGRVAGRWWVGGRAGVVCHTPAKERKKERLTQDIVSH